MLELQKISRVVKKLMALFIYCTFSIHISLSNEYVIYCQKISNVTKHFSNVTTLFEGITFNFNIFKFLNIF